MLPSRRSRLLGTAVLAVLLASCASGTPQVEVVGPVHVAAPVAGSSQVALTLVNRGDGDDELVSVSSDAALAVEIHRTTIADGSATMETLDGLPIGAGEEVVFRPGGLHLMLVVPDETVREGGTVGLVLDFERSEDVVVEGQVVDLLDLAEGTTE
ncbi:copper chaperone PCu(A)C [Nitriliruptor alkaliphilus]|uniref:copper chaperone PCu(A)C n=1 Tax=Nitriliruptor alkaliphilus TaxID=427918 RepID=UPI0006983E48|nr:copper chaperone PCu(A)C [Nitriliruptor alkaliphilus]